MIFSFIYLRHSQKKFNFANVIELERHIEILLLSNDCVIVPDFGGFMAHHVGARYDDGENLFLPPLRTLGFNPQLKMNDSLLAQSYIEAYDISYPEAIKRIDDEVRELNQHLANEGVFELNDIGVINLNESGHYVFEPCEAGILSPDMYGLSSFEFKQIHVLPSVTEEKNNDLNIAHQDKAQPVFSNPSKVSEDTNTTTFSSIFDAKYYNDENYPQKTISISLCLLRNIAVACIVIFLFLLYPSPLSNGENTELIKSKIDTGMLCHIMPKDIVIGKANVNIKTADNNGVNNNTKAKVTNNFINANDINHSLCFNKSFYCIVLASRITNLNAKRYVNMLHKRGYEEVEVLHKNNSTKVIYGQYKTENEAYNTLQKLHNKKDFADAWVMQAKPAK